MFCLTDGGARILPWFLSFNLPRTSIHAGARDDRHMAGVPKSTINFGYVRVQTPQPMCHCAIYAPGANSFKSWWICNSSKFDFWLYYDDCSRWLLPKIKEWFFYLLDVRLSEKRFKLNNRSSNYEFSIMIVWDDFFLLWLFKNKIKELQFQCNQSIIFWTIL